ncbi:MAG: fibronectin type III domain-containing protein, partial [Promethearchaeota archaeon]
MTDNEKRKQRRRYFRASGVEKKKPLVVGLVFSWIFGIFISLIPVALLIVFSEDLAAYAQDENYRALVFTVVPLIVGSLWLLATYLIYLGVRKRAPIRTRSETSRAFKIISVVGVAAIISLSAIVLLFYMDDLADGDSTMEIIVSAIMVIIGVFFGGYYVFGIVRKNKTRRAIAYTVFSSFLIIGTTVSLAAYQLMRMVPQTRGPYLSWADDPSSSMTIAWECPRSIPHVLEWSNSTDFSGANQVTATEHDYRVQIERYHYNVTIHGLEPNTTYYYRIPGFHDDATPFTTAPNVSVPFTFFAYGDSREVVPIGSEHKKLMDQMVTASKSTMPAFILNSGDVAYDFDETVSWDIHFGFIKPLAQSVPYFISSGNHEWTGNFDDLNNPHTLIHEYPSTGSNQLNETSYAFQYSNAYVISVGYPHAGSLVARSWLESQLSYANSSSDIDWIFLIWHRPPFTQTTTRSDNNDIKNLTADLCHKYDADLVFLGHDHNYQRINITHSSNYTHDVTYVVTGGGGASLYGVGEELRTWDGTDETGTFGEKFYGQTQVAISTYEWMKIDVSGSTATIKA